MDDATREQILDKRIQARLATDRAYLNAENAEEQAEREEEIESQEAERLQWEQRDRLITKALGIGPGETLKIELDESL